MFLIVAGITIVADMSQDQNNPLAKRAEFMEELSTPYTPDEVFEPGDYKEEEATSEEVKNDPDFRDVVVADKYRVHG